MGKSKGEARQTQTFLGHPLACSVAYETIKYIQKYLPTFQKELINIDNAFFKFKENMELKALSQKFPFEIRGKGFMKGIWFYSQDEAFCVSLMETLLENGFIVLPEGPRADVLSLTPPLIANAGQYNKILNSIVSILENK